MYIFWRLIKIYLNGKIEKIEENAKNLEWFNNYVY